MIVTILQPALFPWMGYFNMIRQSDVFVFYDDVQIGGKWYTHRNRIRFGNEPKWFTVPVKSHRQLIRDVKIEEAIEWRPKLLSQMQCVYGRSPCFEEGMKFVNEVFTKDTDSICELAIDSVKLVTNSIGLKTEFVCSSSLNIHHENRTQRLVDICKHFGAKKYITGMKSADYMEPARFGDIELVWHDYKPLVYQQGKHKDFVPYLSCIDVLMNVGVAGFKEKL